MNYIMLVSVFHFKETFWTKSFNFKKKTAVYDTVATPESPVYMNITAV